MKKNKVILVLICTAAVLLTVCGCKGNAVQETEAYAVDSVKLEEEIIPAITLESDSNEVKNGKCSPGDYICLVSKDKTDMTYSLMTKKDGEDWKVEKRNVGSEITVKVPEEPCFFSARLVPYDKKNKDSAAIRSFYITVCEKTGQKLSDNGSKLSTPHVCCGDNEIMAYPSFSGGTPPYKYSYTLIDASLREKELCGYCEEHESLLSFSTVPGRYEVCITAKDCEGRQAQARVSFSANQTIPMENIYQYSDPALPTGCEATALASCLNYYGYKVTKNDIADKYIKKVLFTEKNGELIGADPENEFAGDPNSENAYGCFSGCIVDAANKYFRQIGSPSSARSVKLDTPEQMYKLLESGKPVLIWSTMFMWETVQTDSWKTADGKVINWLCNEHCYVLTGMSTDRSRVYVADPMTDTNELLDYDSEEFLRHYRELGSHAVVIDAK